MGFRFRRSIKIAPGLRWNISKTGTSWSFGRRGFTLDVRGGKVRRTVSIPGTGLSHVTTRRISRSSTRPPVTQLASTSQAPAHLPAAPIVDPARFGITPEEVHASPTRAILFALSAMGVAGWVILSAQQIEYANTILACGLVAGLVGFVGFSSTTKLQALERARCEAQAVQELAERKKRFTARMKETQPTLASIRSLFGFQAELGLTDEEVGPGIHRYREVEQFLQWQESTGGQLRPIVGYEALTQGSPCFFVADGLYDRRGPNDHRGRLLLTNDAVLFDAIGGLGVTRVAWKKLTEVTLDGGTVSMVRLDRQTPLIFRMDSRVDALKAHLIAKTIHAGQFGAALETTAAPVRTEAETDAVPKDTNASADEVPRKMPADLSESKRTTHRRTPRASRERTAGRSHDFMAVVGESHHQDALRTILKTQGTAARAILEPEPSNPYDGNAIRVAIAGEHVGYLAQDVAKQYAPYLSAVNPPLVCDAELRGGTPDKPSIGVVLDFAPVYQLRDEEQPF